MRLNLLIYYYIEIEF